MEEQALVFDIQRFSVHDGPGIRTLVFLKGCSLSCHWCSNPDGISPDRQIKYRKSVCIGCDKCLACPEQAVSVDKERGYIIDRDKCVLCGKCVEVCIPRAKQWAGELKTVDEVFQTVKRDVPFFADEGGITLGGGEALLHPEFARALLARCKENGITTAIETAGNYPFENLEMVVPVCDTILYDIKGWDKDRHLQCTGSDNRQILDNLTRLDQLISTLSRKPSLIVRIPLLPGYNMTQVDMDSLGVFLNRIANLDWVELLPFHNMGEEKYEQLGMDYRFKGRNNLHGEDVTDFSLILSRKGIRNKVISW